ncbi:HYD1 signature containing ADP-ribosyltransferase family protein [Streptomyces sp. enrichment culture]|uniref:HYD1 signature containing ADP-ribosyltransferase family protein n=1 Tax=Streptomyces sp. enrichment culture TaxID=1795815 RepID=UPI003F55081B
MNQKNIKGSWTARKCGRHSRRITRRMRASVAGSTPIEPGAKTRGQLSHAFVRVPWAGHKFTHYFEIDVTGLEVWRAVERPDVYVILNDQNLDISGRIVSHGES